MGRAKNLYTRGPGHAAQRVGSGFKSGVRI